MWRFIFAIIGSLLPASAMAAPLEVSSLFDWDWGVGGLSIGDVIFNIVTVLQASIVFVCGGLFFIGAYFYMTAGSVDDGALGKKIMKGSMIGLFIVLGAKGIMETILYFVYA